MTRTITLLASGTRGDVQPFVALGLGLQQVGLDVRVATHARFRPLVQRHGLVCDLIEGNPSELMMGQSGRGALAIQGGLLRSIQNTLRFLAAARPLYARMLASAWRVCQGSDALIIGLPTLWGIHLAQALHAPCLWCPVQPLSRTSAFPSALLPITRSFGPWGNRLTHRLIEQALWLPWRNVINRWRREMFHAPALGLASPYAAIQDAHVLYGFSRHALPRPHDWPVNHMVTGYWFLDETAQWTPPHDLLRFLDAGAPPLYIGFGSPGIRNPGNAQLIEDALEATNLTAIVSKNAICHSEKTMSPRVFCLAEAPHNWLFTRVAAVVHHGGAGTTGAALRAGAPMVVLPGATDQFFWGERAVALGVASASIPQATLTHTRLIAALEQATRNHDLRQRARKMGLLLRDEDGVSAGARIIQRLVG